MSVRDRMTALRNAAMEQRTKNASQSPVQFGNSPWGDFDDFSDKGSYPFDKFGDFKDFDNAPSKRES